LLIRVQDIIVALTPFNSLQNADIFAMPINHCPSPDQLIALAWSESYGANLMTDMSAELTCMGPCFTVDEITGLAYGFRIFYRMTFGIRFSFISAI
jgi:hypothetical protein